MRPALRRLAERVHHDYVRPERLDELERLLAHAARRGYTTMTLSAFAAGRPADRPDRVLLLRHDVDSDLSRADRMAAMERRLGVTGSWFFRIRTWDPALMRRLAADGHEVGYHYEELATVVKERGAATSTQARSLIDDARSRLAATLPELRAATGLPLDVLAAHGDFANRAVLVSNEELLADAAVRRRLGVRLEAYDVEPLVDARFADGARPGAWSPGDPYEALDRGRPTVLLLLHPRAWGAAPLPNARADLDRLREGVAYRRRCARRARSRLHTPPSGDGRTPKVVHLTTVHPPDDPRIFLKECRTLARAGYEVHLVAPAATDGVQDGVRRWGLPTPPARSRPVRMTRTVFEVFRRARALRADVYHFHDPELLPAGLLLARSGAAVVYDAHEDLPASVMDKDWIAPALRRPVAAVTSRLERAAARRLTAVVAATPSIAEDFAGDDRRLVTVNNFCDVGEFDGVRPRATERAVCFVGAISEIRGIEVMVRAIGLVDARLILAGRFSPPDLRDRLGDLAGWEQVDWVGAVGRPDIAAILARARAGMVLFQAAPNHVRSQPTKMFEYMAAGLPVIASDFPLWREIVEGNRCGLCVDPRDPEAVAAAILRLVDDPEAAREMGDNGRRAARSRYSWDTEAAKLTALYAEILDEVT